MKTTALIFAGLLVMHPGLAAQESDEVAQSTPQIHILQLENVPAHEALNVVQGILRGGASQNLRVMPDQRTNSLIIYGDKKDAETIRGLLEALESVPTTETPNQGRQGGRRPEDFVFAKIALKHANAIEASRTIDSLMSLGSNVPTRVTPDPRTNGLYVMASTVDMGRIRDIAAALDVEVSAKPPKPAAAPRGAVTTHASAERAPRPQFVIRAFDLKHGDAQFVERAAADVMKVAALSSYRLVADVRMNSVLVVAQAQDMARLADIIETLDRPASKE